MTGETGVVQHDYFVDDRVQAEYPHGWEPGTVIDVGYDVMIKFDHDEYDHDKARHDDFRTSEWARLPPRPP